MSAVDRRSQGAATADACAETGVEGKDRDRDEHGPQQCRHERAERDEPEQEYRDDETRRQGFLEELLCACLHWPASL
jgi:hypothetical protein